MHYLSVSSIATHEISFGPANSFLKSQEALESFVQSNLLSTGTTIVGLCCKDGVILGADTRSTGGALVMDKNKLKIHYLSSKISCCAAGTSADCDHISRKVRQRLALDDSNSLAVSLQNDYNTVNTAVTYISEELNRKATNRKPSAVFIVGGVDDVQGPRLYQIDSDTFPYPLGYCSLGSGSVDAISVLESSLEELAAFTQTKNENNGNNNKIDLNEKIFPISIDAGINLVRKAVRAGILNDLGSGSHIDLCVITKDGEKKSWREKGEEPAVNIARSPMPNSVKEEVFSELKEIKETAVEIGGSASPDLHPVLGRKIWAPLSTRLRYSMKTRKLEEIVLDKYDDHELIRVELLPNE